MSKKFLRKNEFRYFNNPDNPKDKANGHPSYISGKWKHSFKHNTITHSRTIDGVPTLDMDENPNKNKHDFRKTRIGQVRWDNETRFGEKLHNWRWNNKNRRKIKKYNRKNGK